MYHHVAPIPSREHLAPYIVSIDTFRYQLDAILRSNLPILTLSELCEQERNGSHTVSRSVVLTFDDCSQELWEHAIPQLHQRSIRATFFSVSSRLGLTNDWDDHRGGKRIPLMDAMELRKLAELGHEIGSHSESHRRLAELPFDEVLHELIESKTNLEAVTKTTVKTLAYPFGEIPTNHEQLCERAGYIGACSIFSKSSSLEKDRYAIRRILLHERDTGLRMRLKLSRAYLEWRSLRDPFKVQ
jgi:peptidoglycan/xylan/chitin deacetylase (PgdA/CDA1 family)